MHLQFIKRHITGILSAVLIIGGLFFVPWTQVIEIFEHIQLVYLLLLIVLGLFYLLAKAYRFSRMLQMLGVKIQVRKAGLLYLSAQHFTFLPGGELVRTKTLKEYADIPVRRSTAVIVQQGLIEAASLLLVSIACAAAIGKGIIPLIAATIIFSFLLYATRSKTVLMSPRLHSILDRLPIIEVNSEALEGFIENNQKLITLRALPELIALSIIPIAAGIGITFVAAHALGLHLSLLHAAIAFILPAALAYVAVLPGTSEGGMVGILVILGTSFPGALALTFLTRIIMFGLNFIIGPLCLILVKRYYDGSK